MSLTDPSLSALSETPVFIGVVLLAVGALLGVIGLLALVYKFLADGIAAAMAARHLGDVTTSGAVVAAEGGDADEATTDDAADESASDTGEAVTPEAASNGTPADEPSETTERPAGADGDVGHADRTPPTTDHPSDPVGAPSADGRDVDPGPESPGEDVTGESDAADSGEQPEPDDPPEWTPPDPSEFDEPGSDEADAESDQWADERTADSSPEADSFASGADGNGRGDDAATAGSPVGEETVVEESGPDGVTDDGRSPEPTGASDAIDPDEIDEDTTLADEGVESFSTASDEDPLSDRLPGSDDS